MRRQNHALPVVTKLQVPHDDAPPSSGETRRSATLKRPRSLREICGTWPCFVVLSPDNCNGCHASSRFSAQLNQLSTFLILPEIFTPSNYEPGGRRFESFRARQSIKKRPGQRTPTGPFHFNSIAAKPRTPRDLTAAPAPAPPPGRN
jgi:hypothetical protein